eukprot:355077-Chlamydomonas_euryale.AAC.3
MQMWWGLLKRLVQVPQGAAHHVGGHVVVSTCRVPHDAMPINGRADSAPPITPTARPPSR